MPVLCAQFIHIDYMLGCLPFGFLSVSSQKSLDVSAKLLRADARLIQKNGFSLQDSTGTTTMDIIHILHVLTIQANHSMLSVLNYGVQKTVPCTEYK